MCGFTCLIEKLQTNINLSALKKANEALSHRGPDDDSIFVHKNIGIGFRRLSIVDLDGGKQPIFNEDKTALVVCNGEIYNSPEIRIFLESRGHIFSSHSDVEVIVHLYEDYGIECALKLQGMFSFILVDLKNQQILIVRDRLGIKPLVIFEDQNRIIISSEAKGILATGYSPRKLNQRAIYDSFTFRYIPGEDTAFEGIYNFPPASIRAVDMRTWDTVQKEYWEPSFFENRKREFSVSPYALTTRSLFEEAVSSHTLSDVPVGAYLSGGIDSTVTAMCLGKFVPPPLTTFSIGFLEDEFDESKFFMDTSKRFGFNSMVLKISKDDIPLFPKVISNIEQPQFSTIDLPFYLLSRLVKESNIKVVLCGEGSDEIFGGYFVFTLNQISRALNLPLVSRFRKQLLPFVFRNFVTTERELASLIDSYENRRSELISTFGTVPAWYPIWALANEQKKCLFLESFRDSIFENEYLQKIGQKIKSNMKAANDFDKSIFLELKTRLPNYVLSRADRNAMAHSVEARVPFLDSNFVDYALKIPAHFKMFGINEKYILRKAFEKTLPQSLFKRKKYGFNSPNDWLWSNADYWRDYLSMESIKKTDIFNSVEIQQSLKELTGNHALNPEYQMKLAYLTGVLSVQILAYEITT